MKLKEYTQGRWPKSLGIIPARYASTRFPGKPLAMLCGKPVIQHVWNRVAGCVDDLYVATDDERIRQAVEAFGGKAVMTSPNHRSGTDRLREAAHIIGGNYDVIVNIQGDEPFIEPSQIRAALQCFADDESTQIATLVTTFKAEEGFQAMQNPNTAKVVVDEQMHALYFSRSVIPYMRGVEPEQWLSKHTYYRHIGLYAYRPAVLDEVTQLPPSPLEIAESLEQLRWLQAGYIIKVAVTEHGNNIGIDTPEDLERANSILQAREQLA